MSHAAVIDELLARLGEAFQRASLVKLTLGAPRDRANTLRNLYVRRVVLKSGPRLSFVYRHAHRDLTKNFAEDEARPLLRAALGQDFASAHLFTTEAEFELDLSAEAPRLVRHGARHQAPPAPDHDRAKARLIEPAAPWLQALGITNARGAVREGMSAKFRQIQKFAETLQGHLAGAPSAGAPLHLVDMGCGKGYLTFAAFDWLRRAGWQPRVRGIEVRPDLVAVCNRVAAAAGCAGLEFETGTIAGARLERVDVLVALHACDTATDDALAAGVAAGARLILAAPCCHKELRPQLQSPPALAGALRHGILRERQAEFVTDALRAALLEWAGYDVQVFEFIATEHTAKNLMIAASRRPAGGDADRHAAVARGLAAEYGIRAQHLATRLGLALV